VNTAQSNFSIFTDVAGSWSEDYINAMYAVRLTTGCNQCPLQYCPTEQMTRWQIAALIIRASYGEDFSYPTTTYFSDVAASDSGFKYIQKMKALGLTKAEGMFYPDRVVTREEMAAFVSKTFIGME